LKAQGHLVKIISFLLFTGIGAAFAQDHFRVIGGIPHLPAVDPSTISAGLPGMMICSLSDKQPPVYIPGGGIANGDP